MVSIFSSDKDARELEREQFNEIRVPSTYRHEDPVETNS